MLMLVFLYHNKAFDWLLQFPFIKHVPHIYVYSTVLGSIRYSKTGFVVTKSRKSSEISITSSAEMR